MSIDITTIIISISAAVLGGFGTAIVNAIAQAKREETRKLERYQDQLKLELKDLKIALYQLEKDLTDWKDKYYDAIQQLIEVKSELEDTLIKLSLINLENKIDD
jgi:uncharacterized protein YlxW (UPF0749 family)